MQLSNQHKAALITFLISASVVMATFAFHIKQKASQIAETFYELQPEDPITEEDVKELEEKIRDLKSEKAETNQAFNQNQESKRFAQAYKTIEPPKDYEYTPTENAEEGYSSEQPKDLYDKSKMVSKDESDKFKKANEILKKQLDKDGNNARSTMSYSLKDRDLLNNPTPIYLCEQGGVIVVNITVNSKGEVIDAYVNTSSSSDNECLEDNAIEYAMKAVFNTDYSKEKQIGTITFAFQGKN